MPSDLWQFLFYIIAAIAIILALILALQADVVQNSPPHHGTPDDEEDNTERLSIAPEYNASDTRKYTKSPVQYFIDKSRLVFEIIVAVFVAGYTITQVEQLSVSRDTESRQLRAYVLPDKISIYNADSNVNQVTTDVPRYNISMKNTGITPAYDLVTFAGAILHTYPFHLIMAISRELDIENASISILPHDGIEYTKGTVINVQNPLTAEQKASLGNGETAIYVYGEALYYDAFDVLRCTRFQYFVGGNGGFDGESMSATPEGNEADKNCRTKEEMTKERGQLELPLVPHYQF